MLHVGYTAVFIVCTRYREVPGSLRYQRYIYQQGTAVSHRKLKNTKLVIYYSTCTIVLAVCSCARCENVIEAAAGSRFCIGYSTRWGPGVASLRETIGVRDGEGKGHQGRAVAVRTPCNTHMHSNSSKAHTCTISRETAAISAALVC